MRLVKKDINVRDGTGTATLIPQEPEDMWHLYNLIRPTDILRAPAIRKVTRESGTGSTSSTTVRTTLTIKVISTDFDAAASALHVAGTVCEENAHVGLGAHHTLDLELQRQFSLQKGGDDGWDSVALEQLREATNVKNRAQVYAVIMQEGLANICLITEHQTLLRQTVEMPIARKRSGHGADAHDKGLEKFFGMLLTTLLRHVDINPAVAAAQPGSTASSGESAKAPPLLLASPGFTASSFLAYMTAIAQRTADKPLMQYARANVLVAHSSSGHVHSLTEVLKSPAVLAKLSDTKYARETALMERFQALIRADDGRAWYGPREVERAVDKGAVGRGGGVLLISNKLFRNQDVKVRKRWVALVEKVRLQEGGEVRVLSSAHESGKVLEGLGDVGAILTFPLLDLDEEEEERVMNGADGDELPPPPMNRRLEEEEEIDF